MTRCISAVFSFNFYCPRDLRSYGLSLHIPANHPQNLLRFLCVRGSALLGRHLTHARTHSLKTCAEGQGDTYILRAQVRDTGIGMPANTVQKLFEPFVQSDSSITRNYGGTGKTEQGVF